VNRITYSTPRESHRVSGSHRTCRIHRRQPAGRNLFPRHGFQRTKTAVAQVQLRTTTHARRLPVQTPPL